MKVIKWLILSLVFLIVVVIIGTETSKAYWDSRVKGMCEKDGGVSFFERVEVSKDEYPDLINYRGVLMIPSEDHAKRDSPFFSTYKSVKLRTGVPLILRFEQSIVRAKDNKELSRLVSYGRQGGDIPIGIFHPSSFSCGNKAKDILLFQSVISIKGE